MNRRSVLASGLACAGVVMAGGLFASRRAESAEEAFPVSMSPEEWKKKLSAQQFAVLREEATEAPFSSPLNDNKKSGTYTCAGCDNPVYASGTKFDSGTGWPSFWAPIEGSVGTHTDYKLIYPRTEVHCARCGGHLGHVFDDGPPPTGKRHCINGVALNFRAGAAS
ncbi:peptide-methionine (R)-S-oxide reductase MsrB [Consotaella salsifontis]|uniref:peptide-methionine (R)-S-oxide reductase n=1 Tax=Consotaella salsifontis TaxID=1365950 RepID=A0A1T4QHQ5_9HYPH|nr:peptide-methionine (R)-S-oxide reductase MsrB [Consotaella salsifontis]SKA03167.1 peptide-methionine (R)-S-oxide reductase [Consotaella salsifontis]